jgi:hypothetical protein
LRPAIDPLHVAGKKEEGQNEEIQEGQEEAEEGQGKSC